MSYFYSDVYGFPGSGTPQQNLNDIVCQAAKADPNQLHFIRTDHRVPGPTGTWPVNLLTNRYEHGQIVSVGQ